MADTSNAYTGLGNLQQAGQVQPASPFDRLSDAVDGLRKAQEMARNVADRLTGAQPPQPASAGALKEIGGGGLIDGVERQTSFIRGITDDIYASLSRIDNRL